MSHRQYGCCFLLFAVVAACWATAARFSPTCVLLGWLAASCVWVATAFFAHFPEMLMGKKQNGRVSLTCCIINLPFLAIYWVTWLIRHFLFRHEPVNVIAGTNVSVSCWPGFHVRPDGYDLVIDMTSEMPRCYRIGKAKYVCLPNLDGVPLDRCMLPFEVNRDMRILVHCAQGRGRSALMACLILLKLGYAATADEVVQLLKRSRPSVTFSRHQMMQIRDFVQNDNWQGGQ